MKVLLVVGVVLAVLCAGAYGLGLYLWRQHGRAFADGGQEAFKEGRAFAESTSSQGCLDEAVERHRRASSFGEMFRVNLFLRSCLDAATPTPGFCDAVPGQFEFVRMMQWSQEQCRQHGLSVEKQCVQLFSQVQYHCLTRAGKAP
jgi:hypothetical protein